MHVSFQLVPIGRMMLSQTALVNSFDAGFLIEGLNGYIVCNQLVIWCIKGLNLTLSANPITFNRLCTCFDWGLVISDFPFN